MRLTVFVLILLAATACHSRLEKKIIGNWTVDEVSIHRESFEYQMLSNIMSFKSNGTCGLPVAEREQKSQGKWTVSTGDESRYINIHVQGNPLTGRYNLFFEKDYEDKLLLVVFENDSIYLKASKLMQDFDSKKDKW